MDAEKLQKEELLLSAIKFKKVLPSQKDQLMQLDVNSLKIALDSLVEIKLSSDVIIPQVKSDRELAKNRVKSLLWK